MKKIGSLLFALTLLISASFAQTKPATKKVIKATTTVTKPAPATTTTTITKKDGTPDKRYKANKIETTKPVVLKKDGTPDKRYKANGKKS